MENVNYSRHELAFNTQLSLCLSLDHHLILGADEGIFTLNLNSAEATLELVSHKHTVRILK